ncbi:Protein of unknown function, partial [Gryllus bimaculatus]
MSARGKATVLPPLQREKPLDQKNVLAWKAGRRTKADALAETLPACLGSKHLRPQLLNTSCQYGQNVEINSKIFSVVNNTFFLSNKLIGEEAKETPNNIKKTLPDLQNKKISCDNYK